MKAFKKVLISALVASALGMAGAASAAPETMTDWFIDTDGAGGHAAYKVGEYLNLTGSSYIHTTFQDSKHFTFQESGSYNSTSTSTGDELSTYLGAKFTGTGSAVVGGAMTFNDDGRLDVYIGGTDTLIASFKLTQGGATLAGMLPDGAISMSFVSTYMAAGYFFDSAMNDLSKVDDVSLGFATTVVVDSSIDSGSKQDLFDIYKTKFGGDAPDDATTDLFVSNAGQYGLSRGGSGNGNGGGDGGDGREDPKDPVTPPNNVPEPGSLALLGASLIGFAGLRRRNK